MEPIANESAEENGTKENVSLREVIYNHRGTFGFAVGAIAMVAVFAYAYSHKYKEIDEESLILKNAFAKVEYNNSVCNAAIEDNKKQNEIISAHLPKYMEQVQALLKPKEQKVVNSNN